MTQHIANLFDNDVYTIKLQSGEELIAKVTEVSTNSDFITLENPVSVAASQQGMQLIPSMFTADPDAVIRLNTKSITLFALTEESVKFKYIEATTGIKIPEKKIVLG